MPSIVFKRVLSIATAFVVFGFLDNFLMVVLGDTIDKMFVSVGVANTLLAAGLGNTFSDAVGIFTGRYVEKLVHIKLPLADDGTLSRHQIIGAETVGIIVGCLLGLFPLLFL